MLPLAGAALPNSPESLVAALQGGLAAHGVTPRELTAAGPWPSLDRLHLDVSGASLDSLTSMSKPGAATAAGFSVAELSLQGSPVEVSGASALLEISARAATFSVAGTDIKVALLTGAASGNLSLQIARAALEQLIHRLAGSAAREHGADVKSVRLDLVSRGPRALSLVAEVTAKAFIATATVKISGDAELDDQMNARLSNLRFSGDGMIGNLVGGVIRPQLAKFEGRTFPLAVPALGELRLRDVQVETGETVRLTAQFGS